MADSTDVAWDINGVSLQTYAWNISTWGGDRQSPPKLRGEDITIPYKPGTLFTSRQPQGRTMTLQMWVIGTDADGKIPNSSNARAEFERNMRQLRNLVWSQGKQFILRKRWKEYGSSTVLSASARAVYVSGFEPVMSGPARGTLNIEIYLSDPFFYGDAVTLNFPATATSNINPTILGDYETTDIQLDVNATRNNFRLTNIAESVWVNVNENVSSNLVRLRVDEWTAIRNPSGTPVNVVSKVTQFGHTHWMVLRPGTQQLSLTSASGSGSAVLTYRPRWL